MKGRFTKTHLLRIHRFLFEDVYPFAGHIRREQISKGDTLFYPPEMIDRQLGRVFDEIHTKKLLAEQEAWDKSLRAMPAQKLTTQANEWLADNDQTDRDPEKDPITEDEFARRILLTEFTVSPGGRFTAWYEDDDMFWGHVITVDGTLKKGPVDADIQG